MKKNKTTDGAKAPSVINVKDTLSTTIANN